MEQNIYNEGSLSTLPKIVITSSSGFTVTYEATAYSDTFPDGSIYYSYDYSDTGIKTLNWNNVEWIDIKTQYVKAHTRTYILKKLQ